MMTIVLAGAGAGLVSALLFAVVIAGSPLALVLSYLAPLPIFIAALGWNHRSGLVAAIVGALATAFAFRLSAGLAYGIGLALPAWWLAYLALLGRPCDRGGVDWYPLGRLLVWIAAVAALLTVAGALAIAGPSYDGYRTAMRGAVDAIMHFKGGPASQQQPPMPGGFDAEDFVTALVAAFPAMTAASFVPMQAGNLWLAARAVSMSGRLPRPWPSIPDLAMPRAALGAFAAAFLLAVAGGGYPGLAGQAVAGALFVAFAFQGLALLHAFTRGRPARGAILGGTYVLLLVLPWLLFLPAIAGMIESAFNLRGRMPPAPRPPASPFKQP